MKRKLLLSLVLLMALSGCARKSSEKVVETTHMGQDTAEAMPEKGQDIEKAAEEVAEPLPEEETETEKETEEMPEKSPEVLFFDEFLSKQENGGFLCSEYDKPQDIDLDELYYNGIGDGGHSMGEDERAAYEEASGRQIEYDMICLTASQIDQHLQEKTGLTLKQMNNRLENWIYLPEYDCYYFQVSDANSVFDECMEVDFESENTVAVTYRCHNGGKGTVTMKKQGDQYLFLSNRYDEISLYSDQQEEILFDSGWKYGEFSKISSGAAVLYHTNHGNPKGIVVCVNAGHGTKGGSSVKTPCHPDQTAKVTGGSTAAGAYTATAVSGGTTFLDGTPEAEVTLAIARKLRNMLLARGYDVLMIRDSDDVQLDNIARTVMANQLADCHIALHWDSTENDKGAFYIGVPDVASYRAMEPVASHWTEHEALGECLIKGLGDNEIPIYSDGRVALDLTQTSYSSVPSVDVELGDRASSHSGSRLKQMAYGLVEGIDLFFAKPDP